MLTIENLTKNYGNIMALDHLNLHIEKGEIYGFVGPNGAGKTTAMRIVCGLLKATEGYVTVDDVDAIRQPEALKRKVGYVPDFFGVYDNLKVMEYMEYYGSMYGMERRKIRQVSRELLELVQLSDKENAFVDTLSRGMKQRLCVARALLHNPDLLVLDEPNSGLDPRARYEMKEILKHLREQGKTILISSHILPELAQLCTSIGIMEHGQLVTSGKVDSVMEAFKGNCPIHAKVVYADTKEALHTYLSTVLEKQPFVERVSFLEDEVVIHFNGDDLEAARLLKKLFEQHIMVSQFYREKDNLESLFLKVTGGNGDA